MYTAMSIMHNIHGNGERMLPIPENMVGCVIGRGGRTLQKIMSRTKTDIEFDNDQKRFAIKGTPVNQYNATLDIKKTVARHKRINMDLKCTWFPNVDIKDGIFELQQSTRDRPRLCLKCETEDHHNDTGNLDLILQELPKILNHNAKNNRKSNLWCHFGKIYIKNPIEENKEYSLSEVEKRVIPRCFFATNEEKWKFKFFPGFMLNENKLSILHTKWFPAKYQTCPFYKRCEITFYTPSCNELRLKIFIIADIERSNSVHTIYKSSECPHEIHSVIKSSDSPPYFYICESTPKTGLVDIFEPAAEVDIRLITEAICGDFNSCEEELLKEASILYDYVRRHLKITDKGEVDLPRDDCPTDFDYNFIRASVRETFTLNNQGMVFTAQISHAISYNATSGQLSNEDWDIHLSADDCNDIKPEEVCDKVPTFLRMAKEIARALSNYDQSNTMKYNFTVPSEILERDEQAQKAYQTALKSGKVKNCRLPIVVVGQARSGKTSLLRSLHGEKFDPFEDSTIGAKLQRSSSVIEDSDWMKNETGEHMAYDQFTAKEIVKLLMKPPLTDSTDPNEDLNDVEINDYKIDNSSTSNEYKLQSKHSTWEDKSEGDFNTFPVKKNVSENIVMANVETRQDNQSQASFSQHKNPPVEVMRHAEHFLGNPETAKRIENCLYLNAMDFAGQPVYSVIHPVFIPPKGIFLLVHNLENELDAQATPMVRHGAVEEKTDDHCPLTNINHLEFWLSLVVAYSTIKGLPPVFVVCTHADKLSPLEDAQRTARKILGRLTRENYTPGNHIITDIYTVDNTVSGSGGPDDPGVERLKKAISSKAKTVPQLVEDIPIRWLEFEKRLLSLVNDVKKKYISHEHAEMIALECDVDVQSDELGTLLNYLHDLKVIIYFQEINMIIIDTQWLMDMFSKVITVPLIECHGEHKSEWNKLEHKGIVDLQFLEHLWYDLTPDTPVQSLITIMEKFSLLCKQRDGSFLVPGMLLSAPECNELMSNKDMACPVIIQFKSSHLPFGLFPRLLVAVDKMCHGKWPDSQPPNLSKNFARFYTDDMFDYIFKCDVETIAVALFNEDNPGCRDDTLVQSCAYLLNFLKETLLKMTKESFPWMKSLAYEFGIHCSICSQDNKPCEKHSKVGCVRDTCAHFISEEELLKKKPRCQKNPTKRNVIDTDLFSHWFSKQVEQLTKAVKGNQDCALSSIQIAASAEDEVCMEIVEAGCKHLSMTSSEANQSAKEIALILNLDKSHMEDPPKDIIAKCRRSCKLSIAKRGKVAMVLVDALRDELPSGMTGPLKIDHGTLVKYMDYNTKEQLSQELTVEKMKWKVFAKEKVGLTSGTISFYDERTQNPVLEILNNKCGYWSVEKLYDAIADSGAGAIADRYL